MGALLALIERLLVALGLAVRPERRLALAARAREAAPFARELRSDRERFGREMERRSREPHVVLGQVGDDPYRFLVSELRGAHAHLVAQPGAGKSRLLTAVIRALLVLMWFEGLSYSVVLVDPKGETVRLVMRVAAELLARLPRPRAEALARRMIVIRPFLGRHLVPLGMLVRDPSLDLFALSRVLLELLWRTAGAAVGIRQEVAGELSIATLVANGISLLEAPFVMREPNVMRDLAERVPEPRLHSYYRSGGYAKEARATIQGLLARIEAVVGIPELGAMLGASTSVDLRAAYAPGSLVLVDLDGGPLGGTAITDAIGSYCVTRLGWACFDPATQPNRASGTLFVVDELARLATPSTLDVAERLLVTSRWLGTSLWTAAQYANQIAELDRLLSANTRLRLFGRTTAREIEAAIAEWVGTGGRRLRADGPGRSSGLEFMTEAEEARDWSRRVARLPRRRFVVGDRSAPFGARVIEAPHEDPIAWRDVDPEIRDMVERGGHGVERGELLRRARAIQTAAAERLLATAASEPARTSEPAPLPNLAETRARRPRRREVP